MKYIVIILIFFLCLYGYIYYIGNYPQKTMLKYILIPGTRNTYFRVYQYEPFLEDSWDLYYEVIEDNKVICPFNHLAYVHVSMEPFEFELDTIGEIAYISCCPSSYRIDATYNLKKRFVGIIIMIYQIHYCMY